MHNIPRYGLTVKTPRQARELLDTLKLAGLLSGDRLRADYRAQLEARAADLETKDPEPLTVIVKMAWRLRILDQEGGPALHLREAKQWLGRTCEVSAAPRRS